VVLKEMTLASPGPLAHRACPYVSSLCDTIVRAAILEPPLQINIPEMDRRITRCDTMYEEKAKTSEDTEMSNRYVT